MKRHPSRQIPFAVGMGLALAMLALGFLAALGARSLVVGTASADPAVPNPGHSYTQIETPAGTWPGLDADKLDGAELSAISNEIDADITTHAGVASTHHTKAIITCQIQTACSGAGLGWKTADVSATVNYTMTGGGCRDSGSQGLRIIQESYPVNATTWRCSTFGVTPLSDIGNACAYIVECKTQ